MFISSWWVGVDLLELAEIMMISLLCLFCFHLGGSVDGPTGVSSQFQAPKRAKNRVTPRKCSPKQDGSLLSRAMSPLRTPSVGGACHVELSTSVGHALCPCCASQAVANHEDFSSFSSETTLSVHSSVKSVNKIKRSFSSVLVENERSDSTNPIKNLAPLVVNELDGPDSQFPAPLRPTPRRSLSLSVEPERPGYNVGLAAASSIAYASFIFCRSWFTVTQAVMKRDLGMTDSQANNIITSCAVVFGLSKFPAAQLVNTMDGPNSLLLFMAATAAIVAFASTVASTDAIYVVSLLNALPQAGAYPAVTKLVCAGFNPEQRASVFALISIGSRLGQVAVSLVLGEVLRMSNSGEGAAAEADWRTAVRVAPCVVLAAMGLLFALSRGISSGLVLRPSPRDPDSALPHSPKSPRSIAPSPQASLEPLSLRLWRLATTPRFWFVNLSAAMLLISKGFDMYAVRFISNVCEGVHAKDCQDQCMCKDFAPQITAGVSLGIVASLLVGSLIWERLTKKLRAVFIVALCALNVAVAASMLFFSIRVLGSVATSGGVLLGGSLEEAQYSQRHTLALVGTLLFLLGFSSGYPFYVPQSLFAVEFGSRDAATVVGCGECVQSVLAAAFIVTAQHYAVRTDETTDWVVIWTAILGASLIGFVLMAVFMSKSLSALVSNKSKAA